MLEEEPSMPKGLRILLYAFVMSMLYIQLVCSIDNWKNDDYSSMKIAKRIPQSIFWNFEK